MERPPHERDGDERVEQATSDRVDVFGRVLGERWQSDGQGIYRLVPRSSAPGAPAPPPAADTPGEAAPADELSDAVAPWRSRGRGEVEEPSSTPRLPGASR